MFNLTVFEDLLRAINRKLDAIIDLLTLQLEIEQEHREREGEEGRRGDSD